MLAERDRLAETAAVLTYRIAQKESGNGTELMTVTAFLLIFDTSELYHVIYAIFWIVVSHNAFHLYLHPIIIKILILSGIGQYIIKNISFRITLFWLVLYI